MKCDFKPYGEPGCYEDATWTATNDADNGAIVGHACDKHADYLAGDDWSHSWSWRRKERENDNG